MRHGDNVLIGAQFAVASASLGLLHAELSAVLGTPTTEGREILNIQFRKSLI
jgi:hypothetical protein